MPYTIMLDFETHSASPLRTVGALRYSQDPSTRVLMMSWKIKGSGVRAQLWWPGQPLPEPIVRALGDGGKLSGWNSDQFERHIWEHVCVRLYGFPRVPDDVWEDTMFRAAAANLPRSLEGAAMAVGAAVQKDKAGHTLMMRITNANRTPFEKIKPDELQRLGDYCIIDTDTEEATEARLPAWPDVWPWRDIIPVNRRINNRGVLCDVKLVQGLERATTDELRNLDYQMAQLTYGAVEKTSKVEDLKRWLVANGVKLEATDEKKDSDEDNYLPESEGGEDDDDSPGIGHNSIPEKIRYKLRKQDIANLIADPNIPDHCREALEIRAEAAKASTKKLKAMLAVMCPDGRLRQSFVLGGAQQTMRWSGAKWQPHNFPRVTLPDADAIAKAMGKQAAKADINAAVEKALMGAIQDGYTGDADLIRLLWGPVLPFAAKMMRRTLCAPAGHYIIGGDYAQVEARITMWLSGNVRLLDAFAQGKDVYRITASPIFGLAPEALTNEQRQIGKVCVLGLGFGGGTGVFPAMAQNYGLRISLEEAKPIVTTFRDTNPELVKFWYANLEAAIAAVAAPGREFAAPPGHVSWIVWGDRLMMRLPSGRFLSYWQPRLERAFWSDGSPRIDQRTGEQAWDLTTLVCKGKSVLRRKLWHGLAIENCLGADTPVLTSRGVVALSQVRRTDMLWDGDAWVTHDGVIFQGVQTTLDFGGVDMTPDHKVEVDHEWQESRDASHDAATASYARHHRLPDRLPDGREVPWDRWTQSGVVDSVRLRHFAADACAELPDGRDEVMRMQDSRFKITSASGVRHSRNVEASGVFGLAVNERPLPAFDASVVGQLRRSRDHGMQNMGDVIRGILARHGADISSRPAVGAVGQLERLQPQELCVGRSQDAVSKYPHEPDHHDAVGADHRGRGVGEVRCRGFDVAVSSGPQLAERPVVRQTGLHQPVFDILNAGPRRRFTVFGAGGLPFVVSNCAQAIAADMLCGALVRLDGAGLPVVAHVHDSTAAEVSEAHLARDAEVVFKQAMSEVPTWATGLPVGVDLKVSTRFS